MRLTSKQKKIAKWVGYPLVAIFTFVFTLAYTFPYDRLKDKIIDALSDKYDVTITSIEPSLVPGTFTINTMVLRTRPKAPTEKPVIVLIDEVEVNIGVMSAVFWSMDMSKIGVEVEAKIAGGTLGLEIEHEKGTGTLALAASTKMLPIASVPGVREAVGLPMTGGLSADIDVTLPKGKWSKADGSINFSCVGCTVGDGVAKMKMKPPPGASKGRRSQRRNIFAGDGLTVPRLNLGAVLGEIDISKGKGLIKTFAAKSQDGFLNMEGEIDFRDPFKESRFPGCMKFGFSEELKERQPKFMGIEAGLPPRAKQEDGSYAIPTKGKLVELRFDVRRQCGQKGGSTKPASSTTRKRPSISRTVDDNVKKREMPSLSRDKDDDTARSKKEDDVVRAEDSEEGEISTASGPNLGRFRSGKERIDAKLKASEGEDEDEGDDEEEDEDEDEDEEEEDEEASEDEDEEGEGEDAEEGDEGEDDI